MGVHAIDGMIDLVRPDRPGLLPELPARREVDADDTTSMLFRMKDGMSGYLGTMTATGPGFSFQVFGSKGWVRLEGMTHVAGRLVGGAPDAAVRHVQVSADQGRGGRSGRRRGSTSRARASTRSRRRRAAGRVSDSRSTEMVHGAAVTEAVVRSAATGQINRLLTTITQTAERRALMHSALAALR